MSDETAATITAYPDGPYLVRGSYRIIDVDGKEIESCRRTIALCRCGRSAQKPLCDGTHGLSTNLKDLARIQRTDPAEPPGPDE